MYNNYSLYYTGREIRVRSLHAKSREIDQRTSLVKLIEAGRKIEA